MNRDVKKLDEQSNDYTKPDSADIKSSASKCNKAKRNPHKIKSVFERLFFVLNAFALTLSMFLIVKITVNPRGNSFPSPNTAYFIAGFVVGALIIVLTSIVINLNKQTKLLLIIAKELHEK